MNNDLEIIKYDLSKIKKYDALVKVFKDCFQNEVIKLLEECEKEIIQTRKFNELLKQENETILKDCREMAYLLKKENEKLKL